MIVIGSLSDLKLADLKFLKLFGTMGTTATD